jgi:hypothetical protein
VFSKTRKDGVNTSQKAWNKSGGNVDKLKRKEDEGIDLCSSIADLMLELDRKEATIKRDEYFNGLQKGFKSKRLENNL